MNDEKRLSAWTYLAFGSGDLAQNLIYQTISIYLLLFYTNVYGLAPSLAAGLFLAVRLADVLWDPLVGAFVDQHDPRWGKYRSYLLSGGIPLAVLAIASFWTGFSPSFAYAIVTYGGLSLLYTLVNVPYGALNASLSRKTEEITALTSVRMFMANVGGLLVGSGVPWLVCHLSRDGQMNTATAAPAWLATMSLYAVLALGLLVFCFAFCRERIVMASSATAEVKVSDLWTEFRRNRPLRVLAFFFITSFAMLSVGNAAGSYFLIYNLQAEDKLPLFMALGTVPAFILMPCLPLIRKVVSKHALFYWSLGLGAAGLIAMYVITKGLAGPLRLWGVMIAQVIKSAGILIATGYMWALVPEVISYGELRTGRRLAGIINALTGIFYKAGMAIGGVIPAAVLAGVGFQAQATTQSSLAQEGVLWVMTVIPAGLLILAAYIVSRYELTDEVMNEVNRALKNR